eukprot:scaffold16996_cov101-Isochrysis_galbana.AAC.2
MARTSFFCLYEVGCAPPLAADHCATARMRSTSVRQRLDSAVLVLDQPAELGGWCEHAQVVHGMVRVRLDDGVFVKHHPEVAEEAVRVHGDQRDATRRAAVGHLQQLPGGELRRDDQTKGVQEVGPR